jgi:protein involved in polysaccharide export with SLBB domain
MSGVTNTGTLEVTGDVGVSPIISSAITGLALEMDESNEFSASTMVEGKVMAADYTSGTTKEDLATDIADMIELRKEMSSLPYTTKLTGTSISGKVLTPGVYHYTGAITMAASTKVTLTGGPDDIFVFQSTGALTLGANAVIELDGGVKARNVFWTPTAATFGASAKFQGVLLTSAAANYGAGAEHVGHLYSQSHITMAAGVVIKASRCSGLPSLAPTSAPTEAPSAEVVESVGRLCNFAILAETGVTNTGALDVTGDVGVSPIISSAITGLTLILDESEEFSASTMVEGKVMAADYTSGTTKEDLAAAVVAMTELRTEMSSMPYTTKLTVTSISGKVLTPGVYHYTGAITMAASTKVTLTGGPDDIFVIQCTGAITLGASAVVELEGGVQAKNVYWTPTAATFGASAKFQGVLLPSTAATYGAGAEHVGHVYAQTHVTTGAGVIIKASPCE